MRVALDDVTMQGANLVILSRLNVHMVKIEADVAVQQMQALAALVRAARFDIVVERVETAEQAAAFAAAGIHFAQGDYFSEPLDADRFLEYARA